MNAISEPEVAAWRFTPANLRLKRGCDLLLSVLILTLMAPVMLLLGLAVKINSPGPIVFKQRRVGLHGEVITIYKFRSMRTTDDGDVVEQATRHDPRLTVIGALLRRSSLDELPQFINVLQGRMSIVGPRPHALAHDAHYRGLISGYAQRQKVRPGITGWAQVSGWRGETDTLEKMQARVDHDLEYLKNWTIGLDLRIMLKTVKVMLGDSQAH